MCHVRISSIIKNKKRESQVLHAKALISYKGDGDK